MEHCLKVRGLLGVMKCISKCSSELEVWNREVFGYVNQNLHLAQARLNKLQVTNPLGQCHDDHKQAQSEVQIWLEREEQLRRQHS